MYTKAYMHIHVCAQIMFTGKYIHNKKKGKKNKGH